MERIETDLIRRVESHIRQDRLLEQGNTIVAAVSGGPDSTALLHLLVTLAETWRFRLIAAHVNHMFRGEESDREAEVVRALAGRLGIPCEIGVIDVPAYIRETGMNAQAAAREKRYDFLLNVARRYGAGQVALAHHADDQAETVLMRILRGTGPSGLTGIPSKRIVNGLELVRPLLRIYKSELERYCVSFGLPVCRDSSNLERKYTRNQIRLDVMPYLQQWNPQLPQSLNRLADLMRAEEDYILEEATRVFEGIVRTDEAGCHFSAEALRGLHVALQRRLIKLILNYVFSEAELADFTHVELIRNAVFNRSSPSLTLDLEENVRLIREYDAVSVVRQPATAAPSDAGIPEPIRITAESLGNQHVWAWGTMKLIANVRDGGAETQHPESWRSSSVTEAFFDLDGVAFPLTVRTRRPGDRVEPYGLNGTKKVKDMFIDKKVAPGLRARLPIVEDAAGRILWIPNVCRSRHALVSERTKRVLYMKLNSGV